MFLSSCRSSWGPEQIPVFQKKKIQNFRKGSQKVSQLLLCLVLLNVSISWTHHWVHDRFSGFLKHLCSESTLSNHESSDVEILSSRWIAVKAFAAQLQFLKYLRLFDTCIVHGVYIVPGLYIVEDLELSAVLIGLRQAPDLYAIFSAYFCLFTKC